jgi:hypothetical protein
MDDHENEPQLTDAAPAALALLKPATRHDGWDGERMAIFCETLAETAVVAGPARSRARASAALTRSAAAIPISPPPGTRR